MLDIIIKFLEKLLKYLKVKRTKALKIKKAAFGKSTKIDSDNLETGKLAGIFLMLIAIIIGFLLSALTIEIFENTDDVIMIGSVILVIIINLFLLFTFYRNLNSKYFYLIHLPLSIGFFASIAIFDSSFSRQFGLYNTILNVLLIIFPLIHILQYYFKSLNRKCIDKLRNFFYLYNLSFFFVITLNILLITIGVNLEFIRPWSELVIEILGNNYISGLFEGLLYLFFVFICLLYWVYTLHIYYDYMGARRKNLHKGILVFLVIYCLGFTSTILDEVYDYQIERANKIIHTGGNNYEAYKDAKVLFLDRAFYNRIKQGRTVNEELFNKIYDTTYQDYYGEKISKYINNRRSFATNASNIGDSANVVLKLSEIENRVFDTSLEYKVPLLETTYKFHFTNETNESQEVILNFETPSKDSVISGLRLGMDLELIGQISPRGAARQVYEDSLRKNIDPALIEKVGLNTYSLKVFPIPSKTGKTGGRQLVEVKILSPLSNENITYSPSFSIINLKFDDSSRMQSKIYSDGELVKEDIIKSDEIEKYISKNHTIDSSELNINLENKFSDVCLSPKIQSALDSNNIEFGNTKNIGKKIKVFFDNSKSVDRNDSYELYEDIYDEIKNYKGKLNDVDLYSYNFDVVKLTDIEDINYWGYSDIDRAVDYIVNNKVENEEIIFITDDDNFNLNTKENSGRNLEKLVSNDISVIKIGKKIKTYKSDFNTILSATNGNIYNINNKDEIKLTVDKILDNKNNNYSFKKCETKDEIYLIDKGIIEKGFDSDEYLSGNHNEYLFNGDLNKYIELNRDIYGTGKIDIVGPLPNPYKKASVIRISSGDIGMIEHKDIILDENIEKIQAGIISNLFLGNIKDKNSWNVVARNQTILAEEYEVVNQFNSLIALETEQQQRDLDRYKEYENKYETEYDNSTGKSISNGGGRMFNAPSNSIRIAESRNSMKKTSGIQFSESMVVDDGLRGSSSSADMISGGYTGGVSMNFSGRTEISFIGLILMIIYLLEYVLFISFIIKYKNEKKDEFEL